MVSISAIGFTGAHRAGRANMKRSLCQIKVKKKK